ncbi:hypothetical protein [Streptomyces vilmorinianum]|uniref:hypothetical protein n=1 Tax=Streptomyces vilmorinianum TaxID=3051092 RepID=UPI0032E7FE5E
MAIDVTAERVIPLPCDQVAGYATDWRHDAEWTQGIRTAELTRQADAGGFGSGRSWRGRSISWASGSTAC